MNNQTNKITQKELEEIRTEYLTYRMQNNSVFKATFLVASKHQFLELTDINIDLIPHDENIIALLRNDDNCLLVIRLKEVDQATVIKVQTALFYDEI